MSKRVQPPSLATTLAGIGMDNPVMVASGTFGYGPEYADLVVELQGELARLRELYGDG